MSSTVLIVEDEIELVRILRDYLQRAGFRVQTASNGPEAVSLFRHDPADLVLLDLNLPGMDGLDVARELRRTSQVPLIMVTARVEETDRLIGLDLGADDYVSKPFSPREVVARVRAVLRRSQVQPQAPSIIRSGEVEIDLTRHRVAVAGREVQLTPTEFDLLAALARQPGRAFSRLQLLESTQGEAYEGYERTIDAHVKNLRAKIEPDPKKPRYILTVFGVGYRFHEEWFRPASAHQLGLEGLPRPGGCLPQRCRRHLAAGEPGGGARGPWFHVSRWDDRHGPPGGGASGLLS
ncbi:MAG: response regulator transcription factor [Chloroflexota bacterium]